MMFASQTVSCNFCKALKALKKCPESMMEDSGHVEKAYKAALCSGQSFSYASIRVAWSIASSFLLAACHFLLK